MYVCEYLMLTNSKCNTRKHIDTHSTFYPCGYSITKVCMMTFAELGAIFHNSCRIVKGAEDIQYGTCSTCTRADILYLFDKLNTLILQRESLFCAFGAGAPP